MLFWGTYDSDLAVIGGYADSCTRATSRIGWEKESLGFVVAVLGSMVT